ncbi:MAG: hypothetical protein NC084_13275 [Bacteroides sp.]|nr:hypothetical protein [Eubacterium sp.]MCM1419679.1 hypothetical protein [Roseburia sp.]MCM1463668.1 hypothetical protein [Bacteroides sp.]
MENSILKDAISEIARLSERSVQVREIGGSHYLFSDDEYKEIKPDPRPLPSAFWFSSLDGLVGTVKSELSDMLTATQSGGTLYITVKSPTQVEAFTGLDAENRRATVYAASQKLPRSWNGETWLDHEEAMIALQSQFVPNEGTAYLLDFLSRVTDENSVSSDDNGVTQTVQVKKGISLAGREQVKPIVALRPYRTFLEIEQPESAFLIRVREGCRIGIIEADGGMWQFAARRSVKEYLEKAFEKEIGNGTIVVGM